MMVNNNGQSWLIMDFHSHGGTPNSWMIYNGPSHVKMDGLGYSHFRKPPWGFLKFEIPQTMGSILKWSSMTWMIFGEPHVLGNLHIYQLYLNVYQQSW